MGAYSTPVRSRLDWLGWGIWSSFGSRLDGIRGPYPLPQAILRYLHRLPRPSSHSKSQPQPRICLELKVTLSLSDGHSGDIQAWGGSLFWGTYCQGACWLAPGAPTMTQLRGRDFQGPSPV